MSEQRVQERTQRIIEAKIGALFLANARLTAEQQVQAEIAAEAAGRGTPDGAQGADGPAKEG